MQHFGLSGPPCQTIAIASTYLSTWITLGADDFQERPFRSWIFVGSLGISNLPLLTSFCIQGHHVGH